MQYSCLTFIRRTTITGRFNDEFVSYPSDRIMGEESQFLSLSPSPAFKSQEDIILENCIEKEYKKILSPSRNSKRTSTSDVRDHRKGLKSFAGVILAIGSGFFFSLIYLILGFLEHSYELNILITWSLTTNLLMSVIFLTYFVITKRLNVLAGLLCQNAFSSSTRIRGREFQQKQRISSTILLLVSGILLGGAIVSRSASINYVSSLISQSISYLSLVMIVILAHICLKDEKLKIIPSSLALLAAGGIAMFSWSQWKHLDFNSDFHIGLALSSASVICTSFVFIIIRWIRTIHFSILLIWLALNGLICSAASYVLEEGTDVFTSIPEGTKDLTLVAAIGICSFGTQLCLVLALKYDQASTVCLCFSSEVLFKYVWMLTFFDGRTDTIQLIGAFIVTACVLIAYLRIHVLASDHSSLRQTCTSWAL